MKLRALKYKNILNPNIAFGLTFQPSLPMFLLQSIYLSDYTLSKQKTYLKFVIIITSLQSTLNRLGIDNGLSVLILRNNIAFEYCSYVDFYCYYSSTACFQLILITITLVTVNTGQL